MKSPYINTYMESCDTLAAYSYVLNTPAVLLSLVGLEVRLGKLPFCTARLKEVVWD